MALLAPWPGYADTLATDDPETASPEPTEVEPSASDAVEAAPEAQEAESPDEPTGPTAPEAAPSAADVEEPGPPPPVFQDPSEESVEPLWPAPNPSFELSEPRYQGPFAAGNVRLAIALGGASNFRDSYLILGAGVGYYWLDGLETSIDGMVWLLGDPFIATVTPGVTYVFYQVPKVHPYLGVFYRHYFVSGEFDDLDAYGGRGGVNLPFSRRGFVGGGVVYERLFSCSDDAWLSCDQWYPEITIAFLF